MPVPPLQWLDITDLTTGSPPPPLKASAMGYDENTRTLVIFGGESQTGLPQKSTYLLNLDSLTWSTPQTKVPTQTSSPSARSHALGTGDFAANSRRDFVIFGGRGSDNEALGDVWAYDYMDQFWTEVRLSTPTQPQPRWGAIGGIDPSIIPGSANNINTTFYVTGGSDSSHNFPSSDLWQLVITGTLASDVTTVQGQWEDTPLASTVSGKSKAGGALISKSQGQNARIVISGGCGSNVTFLNTSTACADGATYVLTVGASSVSPSQCPVPRLGPAIIPNMNPSSSSFASQSFMLLGTFDSSIWDDDGGLSKGEVAILDANGGTWARVLPAGDPGATQGNFPVPRQGAAAFSSPSALVGSNRPSSSDTIVFGGQDSQGNYLNDLWILRAYNGSITSSGGQWKGFGNGQLQSGISASGAGVTVQYLARCAQQQKPTATSSSSNTHGTSTPGGTAAPIASSIPLQNVSIIHRALSPTSIALALAAVFMARLSSPASGDISSLQLRNHPLMLIAIPTGVAAYAIGTAGFATSFTSITPSASNLNRRTGTVARKFLITSHARAGFALFLGLYGLVPMLAICIWITRWFKGRNPVEKPAGDISGKDSETRALTGEKETPSNRRSASPARSAPEVHSTSSSVRRQRAHSSPKLFPGWRGREVNEATDPAPVPVRSFEVVNRPRRASSGITLYSYPLRGLSQRPRTEVVRSLSDISWLERRRSVSAVGELDYALSQLPYSSPRSVSPPTTSRPPTIIMSNGPFVRTPTPPLTSLVELGGWNVVLHILFHSFLLANCILTLVTLFSRAPLATFIVFLIWTVAFYVGIFILAWYGKPPTSILSTAIRQLRVPPVLVPPPSLGTGSAIDERSTTFQSPPLGASPYVYHQPTWRRAVSPEEEVATRTSHGGRYTIETDEPDDDMDDDDRQRHMEEELMRRDVNIVTVPRRKLWITNPS